MQQLNIQWRTEKRKLVQLIPADWNPRTLTDYQYEKLKRSLERFDLAEIPVVNTDNMLIAGHQRVAVLSHIYNLDHEIDVRVPSRELTESEVKEYNVISNAVGGDWDYDQLANNFDLKEIKEWGFKDLGHIRSEPLDELEMPGISPIKSEKKFIVSVELSDEISADETYDTLVSMNLNANITKSY